MNTIYLIYLCRNNKTMKQPKDKRINIRIPEDFRKDLHALATSKNTTISKFVFKFLEKEVEKHKNKSV